MTATHCGGIADRDGICPARQKCCVLWGARRRVPSVARPHVRADNKGPPVGHNPDNIRIQWPNRG